MSNNNIFFSLFKARIYRDEDIAYEGRLRIQIHFSLPDSIQSIAFSTDEENANYIIGS